MTIHKYIHHVYASYVIPLLLPPPPRPPPSVFAVQADTPTAASLSPGAIDFPGLPRYIGEEERALDTLLATGHQEESASEEELVEEEEAYRLLASWCGVTIVGLL